MDRVLVDIPGIWIKLNVKPSIKIGMGLLSKIIYLHRLKNSSLIISTVDCKVKS